MSDEMSCWLYVLTCGNILCIDVADAGRRHIASGRGVLQDCGRVNKSKQVWSRQDTTSVVDVGIGDGVGERRRVYRVYGDLLTGLDELQVDI